MPLELIKAPRLFSRSRFHNLFSSFENSYISENPRTPKPLTFSKNRLRGAKNRSILSPVAKKISEKTTFFFQKLCIWAIFFFFLYAQSRSRFFERNNGLGDIGNWGSSRGNTESYFAVVNSFFSTRFVPLRCMMYVVVVSPLLISTQRWEIDQVEIWISKARTNFTDKPLDRSSASSYEVRNNFKFKMNGTSNLLLYLRLKKPELLDLWFCWSWRLCLFFGRFCPFGLAVGCCLRLLLVSATVGVVWGADCGWLESAYGCFQFRGKVLNKQNYTNGLCLFIDHKQHK
ncbi:hypothetical protein LXL04_018002 [Taraxacum kok-saghyz]